MFEFDFNDLWEQSPAPDWVDAYGEEEVPEHGAPSESSKHDIGALLEETLRRCDAGEVPPVRWRRRMWDCVAVLGLFDLLAAICPGATRGVVFYVPEENTAWKPEVNMNLRHMWPVSDGTSFLVVSFHWLRHLHRFLARDERDKVWVVTFHHAATSGRRCPLHSFMLVLDGQAGKVRMVNCWRGVYTFAQWDGAGAAEYPEGDGATGCFCGEGQLDEETQAARARFGCGRWLPMEAWADFFARMAQLATAMGRNDVKSMHKHCSYLFGVPMAALYCWPPVISASVVVSELCF